jgi:hypothetical protein
MEDEEVTVFSIDETIKKAVYSLRAEVVSNRDGNRP